MKMVVVTPHYNSLQHYNYVCKYFIESTNKYGIEPLVYGLNALAYPGWIEIKINGLLQFLKTLDESITHVLFTDSTDVMFLSNLREIEKKYKAYGSPAVLMSASTQPQSRTDTDGFDEDMLYRFLHCGMYIAELPFLMELLERMLLKTEFGDDAHVWYDMWYKDEFKPTLDYNCEIFQVCGTQEDDAINHLIVESGRFKNIVTNSYPCMIHRANGFSDPAEGKLNLMREVYEKLA